MNTGELGELAALIKGLVGKESLAEATPFLIENRNLVFVVSTALVLAGLALCFFGWKIFKFTTILGGIVSGGLLGLLLGGALAMMIGQALPEDYARWGVPGLFVLIGIPMAILGAQFGRRFSMFGARMQTLRGVGAGGMVSVLALSRFAFFDLSVIWGHALFGAILIAGGAYCSAVPFFDLPDEHLQLALIASVALGASLCVFGAVRQIQTLRSEPPPGYRGEY